MNSLRLLMILGLLAGGCSQTENEQHTAAVPTNSESSTALQLPGADATAPVDYPGLHNLVAYADGFVSGSVPEGDAGFDSLAAMGVRTIISVDGATPDLDRAKAHGLRYIHLPIGYNGFDAQRKLQLVRATRDALAEGPVYIHCHHGKHRSAGAAGTIVASLGWSTPEEMVNRMKVSGTSPSYSGLYGCTIASTVIAMSVIDAAPAEFPEVSKPSNFVHGMIEIDQAFERLTLIEGAGWQVPEDHPDLVPAAEAGRLADLFRLLKEDKELLSHPTEFHDMLQQSEREATALEDLLAADRSDHAAMKALIQSINASCKSCHRAYRDR